MVLDVRGRPPFDSWVGKIPWRKDRVPTPVFLGFPSDSAAKESPRNVGDLGLIPGLGRSLGEGKGYPLQYSGLGRKESATTEQCLHFLSFFSGCLVDGLSFFMFNKLLGDSKTADSDLHFEKQVPRSRDSISIFLKKFNWSIIALQLCVSFFRTTVWVSCMPSLLSLPPTPPPHYSRSSQSTKLSSLYYTADSH